MKRLESASGVDKRARTRAGFVSIKMADISRAMTGLNFWEDQRNAAQPIRKNEISDGIRLAAIYEKPNE